MLLLSQPLRRLVFGVIIIVFGVSEYMETRSENRLFLASLAFLGNKNLIE